MLSPLFGDFRGFPPTLIQAGSNELLLSDSVRLRDRMQAAGVPCRLEVWSDMWHVFQMFPIKRRARPWPAWGASCWNTHENGPCPQESGRAQRDQGERSRAAPVGAALLFLG